MTQQELVELLAFFTGAISSITEPQSGRLTAMAGPFEDAAGIPIAQAIGRTVTDLRLYADDARRATFLDQLRQHGRVDGFLVEMKHQSGSSRLAEIQSMPVEVEGAPRLLTAIHEATTSPRGEATMRVLNTLMLAQEINIWEFDIPEQVSRFYTADGTLTFPVPDSDRTVHPDDLATVNAAFDAVVAGEAEIFTCEVRRVLAGRTRWVSMRGQLLRSVDGEPLRMVGVDLDATDARAAREALQSSQHFASRLIETANVMVVGLDYAAKIRLFNPAAERLTGWTADEVIGKGWFETLVPAERFPEVVEIFRAAVDTDRDLQDFENPVVTADGRVRHIVWRNSRGEGPDGLPLTISFGIDVTDQHHAERELAHRALHDALTDLPNRQLFADRLEQERARVARAGRILAVHMLDLDHFKDINDTFGHPTGDALLRGVADRLRGALRGGDTVARLGGDEFAVLQVDLEDVTGALGLADRLMAALATPIRADGQTLHVATSIGIALCDGHQSVSASELMRRADLALYQAKGDGRDRAAVHSDQMSARFTARVALMQALDVALDASELTIAFQPQVDLNDGRVNGLEALVRWPANGTSPDVFVPVAEQTGRVVALGHRVLDLALAAGGRWLQAGLLPPTLAINVSAVELRDSRYAATVLGALERHGVPPTRLELEVTETALLRPGQTERHTLDQLAAAGVRFAIDDFGTGFSSLRMLESLPAWRIKIAQAFVGDMLVNAAHAEIVRATVSLAREFGQAVIAEGVETNEVREALLALGCTQAQGFLYAHPASEADVTAALKAGVLAPR